MNNFEEKFFLKYVPEWQEIKWVIHKHWIVIFRILFVWICLWVLVPSFLYYNSIKLQELLPFYVLEGVLILIFIKVMYEIFNWYNDVWIITNSGVVSLTWALWNTDMQTVNYDNIEWVWVEQVWIWDSILNKGDVVINKIWDDRFVLEDAIIPYDALDEIERTSQEQANPTEDDKFDLVMDALAWVVENFLKEQKFKGEEEKIKEPVEDDEIIKIKGKSSTIDLR